MATYSLDELHNRWERDEMSVEQMLGHILQHLLRIEREIRTLKDLLLKCAQRLKDQGQ
jgi:pyrroloquinoline quinone (PQQ) biosynthesis protein C